MSEAKSATQDTAEIAHNRPTHPCQTAEPMRVGGESRVATKEASACPKASKRVVDVDFYFLVFLFFFFFDVDVDFFLAPHQ